MTTAETLSFKLTDFEGPLDLLLHLIAKNKLNIYDISVSELVDQYLAHIQASKEQDMDIDSAFLEMAARLIYLKTVSLLPKQQEAEELKQQLQGELIEYQICRQIAQTLTNMTEGFGCIVRRPVTIDLDKAYKRRHDAALLPQYYNDAAGRGLRRLPPPAAAFSGIVSKKIVPVSSKIIQVMRRFKTKTSVSFGSLFQSGRSRSDIVATFLAVLELLKNRRITAEQEQNDILIKIDKAGAHHAKS